MNYFVHYHPMSLSLPCPCPRRETHDELSNPFLAKLINNEKTQEIKTSYLTFSFPEDFMFSFGMRNSFMNDKEYSPFRQNGACFSRDQFTDLP